MEKKNTRSQKHIYLAATLIAILAGLGLATTGLASGMAAPESAPLPATTVSYQISSSTDDAVQNGPCDGRKCTSVLENVPENTLSDTITVLKS